MNVDDIIQPIDKSVYILEDVMPHKWIEEIQSNVLGSFFPWYYVPQTSFPNIVNSGKVKISGECIDQGQFSHTMFIVGEGIKSQTWFMISPLTTMIEKMHEDKLGRLIRAKLNVLTPVTSYPNDAHHVPHVDWIDDDHNKKYWSCVFYLNDSTGDTFIFNETLKESPSELTVMKRNPPKVNTGIMFNSHLYHASSQCTGTEPRVVVNMIWEGK